MESIAQNREISSKAEELAKDETSPNEDSSVMRTNRYFIMKSLTVEDMELSLRNSIWATQAHNEDALNKAFEVSHPSSFISYLLFTGTTELRKRILDLLSQQVRRIFRCRTHGIKNRRGVRKAP